MKRVLFPAVCICVLGAVAQAQNLQFKNPPELSKPNGYTHVVIVNRGKLAFIPLLLHPGVSRSSAVSPSSAGQSCFIAQF